MKGLQVRMLSIVTVVRLFCVAVLLVVPVYCVVCCVVDFFCISYCSYQSYRIDHDGVLLPAI